MPVFRTQRLRRGDVWPTQEENIRWGPRNGRSDQPCRPRGKWGDRVAHLEPSVPLNAALLENSNLHSFAYFQNFCPHPSFPNLLPIILFPFPSSSSSCNRTFSVAQIAGSLSFYYPEGGTLMEKISYFSTRVGCFFDSQLRISVSHRDNALLLYLYNTILQIYLDLTSPTDINILYNSFPPKKNVFWTTDT